MFIARVSANGRPIFITMECETREEAARAAFAARPKAKVVSTCRAHNGRETHADIRFHKRNEGSHQ